MNHLMIDIETLGVAPGSVVASIGAVFFDPTTGEIGEGFEETISVEQSKEIGMTTDSQTLSWWEEQSFEAKKQIKGTTSPVEAVEKFQNFALSHQERKKIKIWGNGASFDPVLVDALFQKVNEVTGSNYQVPWHYWNILDVRTIVMMGKTQGYDPKKDFPFDGVKHSALADARHQAKFVSAIYQKMCR